MIDLGAALLYTIQQSTTYSSAWYVVDQSLTEGIHSSICIELVDSLNISFWNSFGTVLRESLYD
jgi:hypothetical protein